jgi:hypothetical protein
MANGVLMQGLMTKGGLRMRVMAERPLKDWEEGS